MTSSVLLGQAARAEEPRSIMPGSVHPMPIRGLAAAELSTCSTEVLVVLAGCISTRPAATVAQVPHDELQLKLCRVAATDALGACEPAGIVLCVAAMIPAASGGCRTSVPASEQQE